jgi:HlyD family secretion protein
MAGTEIMTVANLEEMEARVDIGEIDVILIAIGQVTRLELDAFRDRKFAGIVTEIANSAKGTPGGSLASSSSSSGSSQSQEATKFEVKIRVREKELFRPGMSVTAEIETRSRTNVLTVPIQSVTTRLPKKPDADKKSDKSTTNSAVKTASVAGSAATSSGATSRTNSTKSGEAKKPGDAPKPIEVVFLMDGDHVKMVPVKRGISDDAYVEITEGLREDQEVISGGYKAINRQLEDDKKVKNGVAVAADVKEEK